MPSASVFHPAKVQPWRVNELDSRASVPSIVWYARSPFPPLGSNMIVNEPPISISPTGLPLKAASGTSVMEEGSLTLLSDSQSPKAESPMLARLVALVRSTDSSPVALNASDPMDVRAESSGTISDFRL